MSTRPTTTLNIRPNRRLEPTHRASSYPGAVHVEADLGRANLKNADLRDAFLYGACLKGAFLYNARGVRYDKCASP
ncbi:pentapeptide repeat-containing protein [Streptomyces bottropensis]|uniref:pentapeptide repeat-containing protein n=1 Tax=Streptomyces bottropensis TaxID=42235 RepID=UPI003A91D8BE